MATSGSTSVTVTAYDTLKFSWWRNSYSTSGNYTDIGWKMELIATNYGLISSSVAKNWSVTVNGTNYSGTNYISIGNNATKTLASGTTRIYHNADGTKTFSYSFSQVFNMNFNGYIGTKSGSGSATLDSIPRYLAITKFDVSSGLETISVAWGTDVARDYTQYSLNNGAWTDAGDTVASGNKSGTFTIKGLTANKTYNVKIRLKRTDSQLWTESANKSITTKDIARISSASNFNLGDNASVTITNPSGATATLVMKVSGTQVLSKNLSTGANTITFTDAQLDAIYKKFGTSNSVTVSYTLTTNNNSNYTSTKSVTCTLKGNQKTIKRNISGSWKRGKVWINVSGTWKRAVIWVKINGTWRRSI